MLFVSDAMQVRNLTRDEFAMNHPAGRIGRRLILRVADVMLRCGDIPTIHPDTLVMDALGELTAKGLGCILVVDADGRLLGTFTDGDLRRSLQQRGAQVGQSDLSIAHIVALDSTTRQNVALDGKCCITKTDVVLEKHTSSLMSRYPTSMQLFAISPPSHVSA